MKKAWRDLVAVTLACAMVFALVGCDDMGFGSKYVTDPEEYGDWESYLDIPSFLPDEIDGYRVNGYSYTLLAYMDICYEIFLDISVSREQFDKLITNAKECADLKLEKAAYYSDGYTEIVFEDHYEIFRSEEYDEVLVGWADIEKIIYNAETLNIVYVCFHANDTGVYELDEVAYFNRFGINEEEYALSIE